MIGAEFIRDRFTAQSAVNSTSNLTSGLPVQLGELLLSLTGNTGQSVDRLAQLGQAGDSFGGLNALVGSITIFLLGFASVVQWVSLNEARRSLKRQQFEDHLFRLLQLTHEAADRIRRRVVTKKNRKLHIGPRALYSYSFKVHSRHKGFSRRTSHFPVVGAYVEDASTLFKLVQTYKSEVYAKSPSTFGPYFRLVFHTFRHISESHKRGDISDDEKDEFVRVARALLSEGAIFLLALNALTYRGWDFVPLIDQMGLLEHMHPKYLTAYRKALRLVFKESAFRGSAWRAANSDSAAPLPPLKPKDFDTMPSSMEPAD